MNDVPVIFLERVVSQFFRKKVLLDGSNLSGPPGLVASEAYARRCRHCLRLTNGQLEGESYLNCEDQRVDIETLGRKHLQYIAIGIHADEEEYSTDPEAKERVLSATKGQHVLLGLRTPNISEEIAKSVGSIRFVFELHVETKITSDVLKMMRLLVEKNTLNTMDFANDVEIDDETAQLLVDLLKQSQFYEMFLYGKCSAVLKEIIASWKENSEEMVGKMVYCEEEFFEIQLSSTEFPFEKCTEEEERDAKLAYPFAGRWPYITRKLVLRNQDGSRVYCLSRPFSGFKTVILFS